MSTQVITVFRGERGDSGSSASISTHESNPNSHPDIRALVSSKATSYNHTQTIASTSWTINHGLNKYPAVITILSDGTKVEGSIIYNGYNVVSVVFGRAASGTAYCV